MVEVLIWKHEIQMVVMVFNNDKKQQQLFWNNNHSNGKEAVQCVCAPKNIRTKNNKTQSKTQKKDSISHDLGGGTFDLRLLSIMDSVIEITN